MALRGEPAYHHSQCVLASNQMCGDVIFAGQATVGSVPHKLTIEIHQVHAFGSTDMQDGASLLPRGRNRE